MKAVQPKKIIRQRFIAADSESLTIQIIKIENKTKRQHLRIINLKGIWRANQYNELVFSASLRNGRSKTYIFRGSWKINDNQYIEYSSEGKKEKLIFKGYWSVLSANRIVYQLEGDSRSRFEFKAQFESANLYPKKGQIRYRIGIGLRGNRLIANEKTIILYGEWKLGRKLGLIFRIDHGKNRINELNFGANVTFEKNKLVLGLKSQTGKPLDITLTLTHKFLKSSQVFIKLMTFKKEYEVAGGVSIPF